MPASLRRLGLFSASSLVIANMIGAGVFTTSGFALADLGDPGLVLVAWAVGGVLAMCGALSYGAFARRMPESGGDQNASGAITRSDIATLNAGAAGIIHCNSEGSTAR